MLIIWILMLGERCNFSLLSLASQTIGAATHVATERMHNM